MKVKLKDIKGTEPRREHGDISDLKASITEVGLIHPPTVDEHLNMLAGRRRYQALMELYGSDYEVEVTVLPVNGDPLKAFRVSIVENLKRKPLTDPEMASAIKDYDDMKRMLVGEAKGGTRTDLGYSVTEVEGWSLQKTANDLHVSKSAVVKAIQIATALEKHPELAKKKSGRAILQQNRQIKLKAQGEPLDITLLKRATGFKETLF